MDKHYISDSLLFDAWCWRDATPAILKRAVQQLATIGVNYTTIEADCWYGERTPALNYELQYTPFKPKAGGLEWNTADPNREWDDRLNKYAMLCRQNNIALQNQLFTNQWDHWRDYTPWQGNLWPCTDTHRAYVHRAVDACKGLDVRYSAGCELSGNADEVAQFHLDVLSIPFMREIPLTSLMLGIDRAESFVRPPNFGQFCEKCKAAFDVLWDKSLGGNRGETVFGSVWQYAHGIHRINLSDAMDTFIYYHGDKSTRWEVSTDGDWTGDSPVDFIEHEVWTPLGYQMQRHVKPSAQQMYNLSAKLFDAFQRPIVIDVFHEGQYDGATGRPVMSRLIDATPLLANTKGVVTAYEERFGKLENHGKPVDPYVPPVVEPPDPPIIIDPPLTPQTGENWAGWWRNNWGYVVGIPIISFIILKMIGC